MVQLPPTTLGQETRWAYSTPPPSPHGAVVGNVPHSTQRGLCVGQTGAPRVAKPAEPILSRSAGQTRLDPVGTLREMGGGPGFPREGALWRGGGDATFYRITLDTCSSRSPVRNRSFRRRQSLACYSLPSSRKFLIAQRIISSRLLFFKNSCQTQLCTKFIHLSSSSSISRSRRGPSRRCTTMSAVDSTSPEISNWACGIVS